MSLLGPYRLSRGLVPTREPVDGPAPGADPGPACPDRRSAGASEWPLALVASPVAATALGVRGQVGGWVPRGPDTLFLLVFNSPEKPENPAAGDGLGWTLLACEGSHRCWSVSLTTLGAGAHADCDHAEAAAGELLADYGVWITGWHHGASNHPLIRRAAVEAEPSGRGSDERSTPPQQR